jgi:D-lactate dehydrogenase
MIAGQVAAGRIISDPLRTLAYGNDASFYRLVPKIVIRAENEAEVSLLLRAAAGCRVPVTFRAAGTSLSGQAVSDSVLIVAGGNWHGHEILDEGRRIRLQPGVIGREANCWLKPFGKKIGPDPASINAAMIGGIAANNASGMCCGTSQNSYRTVSAMRIVFHDGSVLDTGSAAGRTSFCREHADLVEAVAELGSQVRANSELAARIRHKFKIKNTTGYSLNALIDYSDPIDIIMHLLIGSEGTLGFISEIVYDTVEEMPCKASALIVFPGIREACVAAAILKGQPVAAVELMDRAALRAVAGKRGMPEYLPTLSPEATALLVETRAMKPGELHRNIELISTALAEIPLELPLQFTDNIIEYSHLWNVRKGLFPAVGAVRRTGTTVIIEDVAFPLERLAEATIELQEILGRHGYREAIIFGHALAGNLHFVFTQDFGTREEVERYGRLMDEVCTMVVEKYDGSLKAEHGTGRNMAPYVEMEWGREAYLMMQRIKEIFDPHGLLNPGVILNSNPHVHLEHLKPLAATHPLVDRCIECGFCEPVCPSKNLTLTPRQRITVQREISRLRKSEGAPEVLQALIGGYTYQGNQTCATDGLCRGACPVEINTGDLTKELRRLRVANTASESLARWLARHYALVTAMVRLGLQAVDGLHRLIGTAAFGAIAARARAMSGKRLPLWTPHMPQGAAKRRYRDLPSAEDLQVVYFPSCISRTMGPSREDDEQRALTLITERLLQKAGYGVLYPPDMEKLCCGVPFQSKGAFRQADEKSAELERVLLKVTENGRYPVLCDTSPCLYRMRETMDRRLRLYEPVEFVHDFLMVRLKITRVDETVAIHTTCSSEKLGLAGKLRAVAEACAARVVVPERVGCCGFAGDRGFTFPELNASALAELRSTVERCGCTSGYSNSRTCEIGLSLHSGVSYSSILSLVDRCSG